MHSRTIVIQQKVYLPIMKGIKQAKLSELKPDDKNLNRHTEYGMHLLEKSISTLGIGRSIVVDRNNRVIGGNGVVETVSSLGMDDVIIVPTNGKQLVVVKREDVDLDSKIGRELAIADNATAKANLDWDMETMAEISTAFGIEPEGWGVPSMSNDEDEDGIEDKKPKELTTQLMVKSDNEFKLSMLCAELKSRGFKCELKE